LVAFVWTSMTFTDCLDGTSDRSAMRTFWQWLDDTGIYQDINHDVYICNESQLHARRCWYLGSLGAILLCNTAAAGYLFLRNGLSASDNQGTIACLIAANSWFWWIPIARSLRRIWLQHTDVATSTPSRA